MLCLVAKKKSSLNRIMIQIQFKGENVLKHEGLNSNPKLGGISLGLIKNGWLFKSNH